MSRHLKLSAIFCILWTLNLLLAENKLGDCFAQNGFSKQGQKFEYLQYSHWEEYLLYIFLVHEINCKGLFGKDVMGSERINWKVILQGFLNSDKKYILQDVT